MTITQFIAEIESDLFNYAQDIDRVGIKTDVMNQLKIFGVNISEIYEKVLDIKNSKVTLPDNFKSLKLALKLNPQGSIIEGEDFENSYIYKERIVNPRYFDQVNQEYVNPLCSAIVTERIVYKNSKADFYYNYEMLSLVKGIKKDVIDNRCGNIGKQAPHTINITNRTLNTNFNQGTIYIQYYALPEEDGELSIPEITTGDILQYIRQYVKVQIAEKLIANNQNPIGISQLYPMWKQELPSLKKLALNEAKFAGLDKDWAKKLKRKNQQYTATFNLPRV